MPYHTTSNHITIHVTTLMRTLKMEHDVGEHPKALQLAREHAH